jgi:preprotein translocase subunit SecD
MRSPRIAFNILLALVLNLGSLAVSAADTASTDPAPTNAAAAERAKDAKPKKPKKPKPLNKIRVHVEAKRELPERSLPALVGRANPLHFNCEKIPILNESHLENALLVDQPGGFQVRLRFNSMGTKLLESYTAAAAGRHLCIITDIDGEGRWLAAPLVRQRIGDGTISFSPDASREEMERLVNGLNELVRKEKKRWLR